MSSLFDGRYQLAETLGAGGAARVYRALDTRLDRWVALKLLDDQVARTADPAGHDRFVRESQAAARVPHPNLVTVFDAGEADGRLYIAMELVPGGTLAQRIADAAPFPVDEAVAVSRQVLSGLGAVHGAGIVHRDVKPGNILLGPDDRVRLTDFGIARDLDRIGRQVTTDGIVTGTPSFMAPEQATGRDLTAATDLYAVGLVLDEMLTGRRKANEPPTPEEAARAAARAARFDPRDVRPDVSERLAAVVMRATEPQVDRRFRSTDEFVEALDRAQPRPDLAAATVALPASAGTASDTLALDATSPEFPASSVRRRRGPMMVSLSVAAAVVIVVALVVTFAGSGVDTVQGGRDTQVGATPGADADEPFEGETLDGRVVVLRPTPAVPFGDGVPLAIETMTAASRVGCADVLAERDRWAELVGDDRYGDASSVFAQHAQNLALIHGCDPGSVPTD